MAFPLNPFNDPFSTDNNEEDLDPFRTQPRTTPNTTNVTSNIQTTRQPASLLVGGASQNQLFGLEDEDEDDLGYRDESEFVSYTGTENFGLLDPASSRYGQSGPAAPLPERIRGIGPSTARERDLFETGDYAGGEGSALNHDVTAANARGRTIYLNDAIRNEHAKYLHNSVSTTKYNLATFIPKFLMEQFSRAANVFFLFTGCIQQIPGVSPTNRFTTFLTLGIVLLAAAIKEIVEDLRRHRSDKDTNGRLCKVLQGTSFEETAWKDVVVGDIVRLENGEFFPADMVLLSSSEPDALCYIETSNLDGETNLKVKQGLPETGNISTALDASKLDGEIKSEAPNNSLYTYEGVLQLGNIQKPLDPLQLLPRGAQLRNTKWIYGVVVTTGHETKLMKNATATPIKRTNMDRETNVEIFFLFLVLVTLAVLCAIGALVRTLFSPWESYVVDLDNAGQSVSMVGAAWGQFFLNILTFIILFNNLIPISLIVTTEVVKYIHASFIQWDQEMYHEETDTPAVARMSSLVEELGQIEYIFSDKTGTLTCNVMEFQRCTIYGRGYAKEVPEDKRARDGDVKSNDTTFFDFNRLIADAKVYDERGEVIRNFLTLLAVCHTVIPEESDEGINGIVYQASSPDEGALVQGAADLQYIFHTRRPRSVTISANGKDLEYEVLNVCEFNSTRKRMSTVVKSPEGKIILYCKGADTVIFERLREDQTHQDSTISYLEDFAGEGLRTLCLAYREISQEEYDKWNVSYEKASTTLTNRSQELDKVAEAIEKDLILLGATAIEDKLQDGVPDTIHTLQEAGIKVWVLTGDRQETAINIGYSCKLLNEEMSLLICNEENMSTTREFFNTKLEAIRGTSRGMLPPPPEPPKWWKIGQKKKRPRTDVEPLALVIDGRTLDFALDPECEMLFLELASLCKAVICCRVSPLQKALVVKMVKNNTSSSLLAIGDGANDVSMIQAAHVGVGISGREGLQAAMAADFAIAQFRYLQKLLLVHGGWSYERIAKMSLYTFYKNIVLYLMQFWFAFDNGFSGQTLIESWTFNAYNVLLTVFPPLAIGIFNQYVNGRMLERYPQLYKIGQRNDFYNTTVFWSNVANGVLHSLMIYYLSRAAYSEGNVMPTGWVGDLWFMGDGIMYTNEIFTVVYKAALLSSYWTKFEFITYFGTLAFWLVFLPFFSWFGVAVGMTYELYGLGGVIYGNLFFWACLILIPITVMARDYTWKFYKRMYQPHDYHIVQEIQKFNIPDYRPRQEYFRKAVHRVRMIQRLKRNRGYSFSQNESGQADLIRKYDTTVKKEKGL